MTNSTSEREQRIANHMARLGAGLLLLKEKMDAPVSRPLSYSDHVTFEFESEKYAIVPASLLDSEAAGKRDFEWALRELADGWITNNEREGPYGFNQNARRVLQLIANDAAISMRSLCVEKVKAWYEQGQRTAPPTLITALESLTLDQVEQKQK